MAPNGKADRYLCRCMIHADRRVSEARAKQAAARNETAELQRRMGEACRAVRINADVSLRQFAKRVGMSSAMVSDFELGKRWSDDLVRAYQVEFL